ncbi:TetR/AcrR family transcriptional regulator [Microbacterium sp. CPCC 204701]|uniref:TetR/AcrR family transcriptional regulator n=1 Tax=Microbacterium sp. CPCC 204701 TaxID=2493084 RepID=UPI000FD93BE6|nr:TetR/AcrR family transcriptional regulator [Microbacterium sp. CPCC 204701]
MSRPPLAREKVLDAFERILIEEGERAATMDATARAAGVSKGGLLYHFGTKEALEAGLIARLAELVDEDVAAIEAAPEGPVAYFLRSSVMENAPLDRVIIAASRLAQSGNAPAITALHEMRARWEEALRPHTGGAAALDLVMLVSDGLYFNNALGGDAPLTVVPRGEALEAVIALVEEAIRL